MNMLMVLPLLEGGRKVVWWAVKVGRIQASSSLLLLPDRAHFTTCSSDESEKIPFNREF